MMIDLIDMIKKNETRVSGFFVLRKEITFGKIVR